MLPLFTGPIDTVHTPEGCNVTLVCHQPGNVTWLDTGTSQKLEGEEQRPLDSEASVQQFKR